MKASAIAFLKFARFKLQMNLRTVWKITQWKDGCVYRTRIAGYIICTPEYADMLRQHRNFQVGSVSTHITRQML